MSPRTRLILAAGLTALLLPLAACGTASTPATSGPATSDGTTTDKAKGNDSEYIFVVKLSRTDRFARMDTPST